MRAALLLAMFLSPTVALAGDDAWPDSPNKIWFENLQRPDNHKRPYQDKHTKSCCGPGDVVKTKFKVFRLTGHTRKTLGSRGSERVGAHPR